ncbi:hypothetical protein B0H14DRAFT_3135413 [Mycena olivaceomarginata]|nr:hypothetical protein B0H14DRAFT_3135413 [Mycena olivaceomarginata]
MPGPSKGIPTSFIRHATLAATTLKQISDINSTPYLKVVAGVALLILDTVQSVKTNKEECTVLVEQIYYIISAIVDLYAEMAAPISPALLDAMAIFAETLQKIESVIRTQQDMSMLKRFLRQQESVAQLEDCKISLKRLLEFFLWVTHNGKSHPMADYFQVRTRVVTVADVAKFQATTERKHEELLKVIAETHLSDQGSSVLSDTVSIAFNSVDIFHGRESELRDVVHGLTQDIARVAILGPGGIGKTALAKSALHHPDTVDKYPVRYFVSCDSAGTIEDLVFAVAIALGLEPAEALSKAIIKHLAAQSSCLVILDNLETPWERIETRPKVEEFLARLGDLSHVALLITMRGQERPSKIRWTRPFIPALNPLSSDAAYQTFMDIADADAAEDAQDISELLILTENLPLAVTLVASVAALDGCGSVLTRWRTESVSLLSDGFDKGSNLEMSLRLSLSSPRMASCPGALQFLSLLALLPDGISDADILNGSRPLSELPQFKTTLLRTSLAYSDAGRLKVLAPVRELIRKLHPAPYTLVRALRLHWACLLELWRKYEMPSGDLVQRLAGNAGNFNSLLKYALTVAASDLNEVVHNIFHLDIFTSRTHGYSVPLMADISAYLDPVDDNGLRGYYIWHLFDQIRAIPPSEALDLIAQGCNFSALPTIYQANGKFSQALELARRAQWCATQVGSFFREIEALEEEAIAWLHLGNFSRAADICCRTRQLVIAAGLEGTQHEVNVLDYEAGVNLHRTAYLKSRAASELIVKYSSPEKFCIIHGNARVSIVVIDVFLGLFKSEDEVAAALEVPRQIFVSCGYRRGLPICDIAMADFLIAKGRTSEALKLYDKFLRSSLRGESVELLSWCMHKLGDITLRHDVRSTSHWATAYLAYGKTTANVSAVAWALRLLGDIFREDKDDETSGSLFQLALEEFTRMDIYRGKAECLLRLGEIAQKRGEHTVAKHYSLEARNMFRKSGMVAEAEKVQV